MRFAAFTHVAAVLLACPIALACAQQNTVSPHPPMTPMQASPPANPQGTQLIVSYADGPDSAAALAANRAVGATVLRTMAWAKAAVVRVPASVDAAQAIATFKAQPGVTAVQIDARRSIEPIRSPRIGD